jgi:hypothetical protein
MLSQVIGYHVSVQMTLGCGPRPRRVPQNKILCRAIVATCSPASIFTSVSSIFHFSESLCGSLNDQKMQSENYQNVKLELRRVLSMGVYLIDIVISDVSHHPSRPFPSPTTTSVWVLVVVVPVASVHRPFAALDVQP